MIALPIPLVPPVTTAVDLDGNDHNDDDNRLLLLSLLFLVDNNDDDNNNGDDYDDANVIFMQKIKKEKK